MDQPQRMLGYARVSTAEQAASGLGLEAQETAIRRECDYRSWQLLEIVRDEGQTGANLQRPGLRSALSRIAAGDADGLVVAKLDRLSRSVVDFGLLLEWFMAAEAAFVALDVGVDTSTPSGRLVANVQVVVAEWERDTIAARTRDALAALRAQGKRTGGPSVADIPTLVERIQQLRAEGWTLQAIADQLNTEGVPTLRGAKAWRTSSVQTAAGWHRRKPRRKPADLPELPSRTRVSRASPRARGDRSGPGAPSDG